MKPYRNWSKEPCLSELPWLLVGDFKEMLSMDDKMGGVPVNRFKGFKSWFESHDMVDLSFSGLRFTWRTQKYS
ncbi:unnamed protein product [Prunus armeniaca]